MSERTDSRSSAAIVVALGHEVIAPEIDVEDVGPLPRGNDPTSRWSGSARTPVGVTCTLCDADKAAANLRKTLVRGSSDPKVRDLGRTGV